MVERVINQQVQAAHAALRPFLEWVTHPPDPDVPVIANFVAGNPQEPTLPGFVEALRRWSVPASTDWFAYRMMHEPARAAAAASLTAELGIDFAAQDVFLTRGAGGAIALALNTVVGPGDEVVFLSPPWFFCEAMLIARGATPVRVRLEPPDFDLDIGRNRRRVGAPDPGRDHQHPAQSHGADLPGSRLVAAGRGAGRGRPAPSPSHQK